MKLAKHADHEFQHADSFIYDIPSVTFEPYDVNLEDSDENYGKYFSL